MLSIRVRDKPRRRKHRHKHTDILDRYHQFGMSELSAEDTEIPVWLDGRQKWLTGLTKRTTCDDVIYAILYNEGRHETEDTQSFAIFERWRDVERPLQRRTRLLKVWRAWGSEQRGVSLSLQECRDQSLSGEYSKYRKRHRRPRSLRGNQGFRCKCPQCSAKEQNEKERQNDALSKLVITQEKKIQTLFTRIQTTDKAIDKHETKLHFLRVKLNGQNYVQDAYLESLSEGVEDLFPGVEPERLGMYLEICDNIMQLEDHIMEEREKIYQLTVAIQQELSNLQVQSVEPSGDIFGSTVALDDITRDQFDRLQTEINRSVALNMSQRRKLEEIDNELKFYDAQWRERKSQMDQLIRELEKDETIERGNICSVCEVRTVPQADLKQFGYIQNDLKSKNNNQHQSEIGSALPDVEDDERSVIPFAEKRKYFEATLNMNNKPPPPPIPLRISSKPQNWEGDTCHQLTPILSRKEYNSCSDSSDSNTKPLHSRFDSDSILLPIHKSKQPLTPILVRRGMDNMLLNNNAASSKTVRFEVNPSPLPVNTYRPQTPVLTGKGYQPLVEMEHFKTHIADYIGGDHIGYGYPSTPTSQSAGLATSAGSEADRKTLSTVSVGASAEIKITNPVKQFSSVTNRSTGESTQNHSRLFKPPPWDPHTPNSKYTYADGFKMSDLHLRSAHSASAKFDGDDDSNSDTGLSSMHSDESPPPPPPPPLSRLETLV